MRRHDRLGRQGHHQQYDGDARMRRPRQSGGEQNVDQRVGRDRTERIRKLGTSSKGVIIERRC